MALIHYEIAIPLRDVKVGDKIELFINGYSKGVYFSQVDGFVDTVLWVERSLVDDIKTNV